MKTQNLTAQSLTILDSVLTDELVFTIDGVWAFRVGKGNYTMDPQNDKEFKKYQDVQNILELSGINVSLS
jgi:hypothetical protein